MMEKTLDIPLLDDILPELYYEVWCQGNWDLLRLDDRIALEEAALESIKFKRDIHGKIEREIIDFYGSQGGLCDYIGEYTTTLSFLISILGPDLAGRSVVEVGTGGDGIKMLGYLASKGATAIGIDCDESLSMKEIDKNRIEFIPGRWENVGSLLEGRKVDAIYVQYMNPKPEVGGVFEDEALIFGRWGTRYNDQPLREKRKEIRRAFEIHIAEEMKKVLKKGGLFVLRYGNPKLSKSYWLINCDEFESRGYKNYMFRDHDLSERLHVLQNLE